MVSDGPMNLKKQKGTQLLSTIRACYTRVELLHMTWLGIIRIPWVSFRSSAYQTIACKATVNQLWVLKCDCSSLFDAFRMPAVKTSPCQVACCQVAASSAKCLLPSCRTDKTSARRAKIWRLRIFPPSQPLELVKFVAVLCLWAFFTSFYEVK